MANPFQQQARLRKVVYTALILVLFTASLMFRRFIVESQAEAMQLREASRGEVELTSSAVRLTLTGSRGLAVTLLWKAAMKEQEKHKWNEVELLVSSITKLQPYFITPWLFQSWNLAFNVSVECDRPRDKYYYVSRGLQLLAEGERRNQGSGLDADGQPRFPGNPDLRHHMGFTYQLKIGHSDEKNAMQCLLEMSCIDPLERDPKKLLKADKDVDLDKFKEFCKYHPTLVRRISEQLDYNTPLQVVRFLKDNQVVPSRFKEGSATLAGDTPLEEDRKQFPALPIPPAKLVFPSYLEHLNDVWPNPQAKELSPEALSVYLFSRSWFTYAQLPLPRPFNNPGAEHPPFDPVRNRLPKHMTTMLFRAYPAHAQRFMAENLRDEGWFDGEGWTIPEWFDSRGRDEEVTVGTESKYHCLPAAKLTYQLYLDLGVQNGLYLTPQRRKELEEEAKAFRKKYEVRPGIFVDLRPDQRTGQMAKSYFAHMKLAWCDHYRFLGNFDSHLFEADAQRDPQAILANKLFFNAKRLHRRGESPKALATYEAAVPHLLELMLRHPKFREITTVQEETYEAQLKYIRLLQTEKAGLLRPLAQGMCQVAAWSLPPGGAMGMPALSVPHLAQKLNANQLAAIIPMRAFRGPLDQVLVYSPPEHEEELKGVLLLWSQAALPMPMLVYPGQQPRLLATRSFLREAPANTYWRLLIGNDAVQLVRNRIPGLRGTGPAVSGPPMPIKKAPTPP